VAHVGPYHGSVYIDHPAERMREILRPLAREEPTVDMEGRVG
jgi:hypothetical protein